MPEKNLSVLQLEEQEDAKEGKVRVDYEQEVDHEPEGPDTNISKLLKKKRRKMQK